MNQKPKTQIKVKYKSQNIKVRVRKEDDSIYFTTSNLHNVLKNFKGEYTSLFGIIVSYKDIYEYFKALVGGNFAKVGKLKNEDYICKLQLRDGGFTLTCNIYKNYNFKSYNFDYYNFKSNWTNLEVKEKDKVDYTYY